MKLKTLLIPACLLGVSLAISGCTAPASGPAEESVDVAAGTPPDASTLRSWAEAIGAQELAQLAAAELVYRNKAFEFCMDGGEGVIQRAYGKYFRQFRSFSVDDIVRTDSVLRPFKYTIRYEFDVLGTTPILGNPTGKEVLDRVRSDFFFQKEQTDSIVRVYESGPDFRPVSTFSPFLDRPNYWDYKTNAELYGQMVWLREIPESG